MTECQEKTLMAFAKHGGLLRPTDRQTAKDCKALAAKKLLRPQTMLDLNSLAGKNAKIEVAYQITAKGRSLCG